MSDTFREESQKKQSLRTEAFHWRLTVMCRVSLFFRRTADVKAGV